MHGKIDTELDQLVVREFVRTEKARKRPHQRKATGEYESRAERREVADELTEESVESLTGDEEKFIADTVDWLRPRENKDSIVARIQELIAESEPESLFPAGDEYVNDDELQPGSSGFDADRDRGPGS